MNEKLVSLAFAACVCLPASAALVHVDVNQTAGSTSEAGGVTTIIGHGGDIWGSADGMSFAYDSSAIMASDFVAVVRVTAFEQTVGADVWMKSALLARNDLTPGSQYVGTFSAWANDGRTQMRDAADGTSANWPGSTPVAGAQLQTLGTNGPLWLRLVRSGNSFSSSIAPDVAGAPGAWASAAPDYTPGWVDGSTDFYIGIGVTAHGDGDTATGTFDNFSVTAVPEPGSLALLALGFVGIIFRRR